MVAAGPVCQDLFDVANRGDRHARGTLDESFVHERV